MRFLPENNISMIIDTFLELKQNHNINDKLFIIGKENSYFNQNIEPKIKNKSNIVFLGPIYDRNKLMEIWNSADYYIHGHSVGGTNPTLIEALSIGLPILAFNVMFNKKIIGKEGKYFSSKKDLIDLIKKKEFVDFKPHVDLEKFSERFVNEGYLSLIKNIIKLVFIYVYKIKFYYIRICLVIIAKGLYPIPFRTRKSSLSAPMVLCLKTWKSRSLPAFKL